MGFNGKCPNCHKEMIWMEDNSCDGSMIYSTYYCQDCGSYVTVPVMNTNNI